MKLFDIQVFTSDREFDVTLRNLTIIRASQIVHRISVACVTLLRSIKRFLVPGKVVIAPLIKIRSIKSLWQTADFSMDTKALASSRKRISVAKEAQISGDSNINSTKRIRDGPAWRIVAGNLLGAEKSVSDDSALAVDVALQIEKVRKRRLGEVAQVRLAEMDSVTLDELDYIIEP